ncbi:MAG: HD domain-containing protein [Lachnospiraceae bacterium]|nr:HD domain-containing protein [Lachnospiraceae bacterium]
MQHIHSKDIFYLLRDTLKLFDRRPIVHGGKVAYYVYMMLKQKGQLEPKSRLENFELADIIYLATFHDIGAYKTDEMEQMVRFETKNYQPHSLYGQLFFEKMTTIGDLSKVILYHHTDYAVLSKMGFDQSELTSYINFAEAIDIFKQSLGAKFSLDIFKKNVGTKFSPEAFDLFLKADKEHDLFERINSRAYMDEISEVMDFFIMTNEDKEKSLELLMFTLALKSTIIIDNAAVCVALCEKLGALMKLSAEQKKDLLYAAYVHDIGFIAFRKDWLENPPDLSTAYLDKLSQHTLLMEQLLKDRIKREIIVIAATHHERVDGKGYPRRLKEKQMNLSQLILQFSDAVAPMMKQEFDKEELIAKIKRQTEAGQFSQAVTKLFIDKFDEIAIDTKVRSNAMLNHFKEINRQYEKSIKETDI